MKGFAKLIAPLLAGIAFTAAAEPTHTFSSGVDRVALIELYTSEGCSSCPPADRWLSAFKQDEKLWKSFVPLAFHVDYWNYIGWNDPFASEANSQRQRRYAAEYKERTVYTPGVRKAGKEWRRWRFFSSPELAQAEPVGALKIEFDAANNFTASFDASLLPGNDSLQLTVALLGCDLHSEVKRGENRGKTLRHDFVVLAMSTLAGSKRGQWSGSLPEANITAPKMAVAAWVTEGGSLTPLQATGGYLN